VIANRKVLGSALKNAHGNYLWLAPIPIALVVIGQPYGWVANMLVAVCGYAIFFALYFVTCIGVAKATWRRRPSEFEQLTDAEKGKVIGDALWAV
jgi:hypothetical protein